MEEILNLSEDFLDMDLFMESDEMEYDEELTMEGCSKSQIEEETIFDDDEIEDLVSETEFDMTDIEDDYNKYSESDIEDFDIPVNVFLEDEDWVGADTDDYFLF